MVRKIFVLAGDSFAGAHVFSLEILAIGREDELGFVFCCGWAASQLLQHVGHFAYGAGRHMDVALLENGTRYISFVCVAGSYFFDHCRLVAKSF